MEKLVKILLVVCLLFVLVGIISGSFNKHLDLESWCFLVFEI